MSSTDAPAQCRERGNSGEIRACYGGVDWSRSCVMGTIGTGRILGPLSLRYPARETHPDNLDILRRYRPDAAVDLVYVDPGLARRNRSSETGAAGPDNQDVARAGAACGSRAHAITDRGTT